LDFQGSNILLFSIQIKSARTTRHVLDNLIKLVAPSNSLIALQIRTLFVLNTINTEKVFPASDSAGVSRVKCGC